MNGLNDKMSAWYNHAVELILTYGPKIILAIIVLVIGLKIIGKISQMLHSRMSKHNVDATLRPFITSMASWALKAMLFISVASMVGVETTSFVAVLGAAGLAVGLALQGALANFAGGVLILIFRPYKVGDLIESQGKIGVVSEIQIFTTLLTDPQHKRVIMPNGAILNNNITNYTTEGIIRVDLTIGISYDSDIRKAKEVLLNVMDKHEKIFNDPAPFVGVSALADSSVNLAVRPHCHPAHYWDVFFDIQEQGKIALDENNITIPFPQVDVHFDKGHQPPQA
ncbi:mechanosensitive ion channel family protein [Persicobacter psychrovividus]|uniref:Mechanosensitive ion channel protein n=1 Tax=Persicobacter psychrovividus TaxID=387638 RepID=A0ABM7VGS3_9BACT|nr:mechanosensitive ion channel protein [Persicobacter psychrovividus]